MYLHLKGVGDCFVFSFTLFRNKYKEHKKSLESKKDQYEEISNENPWTASKIEGLLSSLLKHIEKIKKGERKYREILEVENQGFVSCSSIITCTTYQNLRKEGTILQHSKHKLGNQINKFLALQSLELLQVFQTPFFFLYIKFIRFFQFSN